MKSVGVIGLGDMGIGLAANLVKAGFAVSGHDLDVAKLRALDALGGRSAGSPAEVGAGAAAVFVMVLNGRQVKEVVSGAEGLLSAMAPGSTIIVSATILPAEMR